MEEYQITGAIQNKKGVLVKVFIDGNTFSVADIYDWIEADDYTFFTLNGKKSVVQTGVSLSGRKYITTHPDGITENNLGELEPLKLHELNYKERAEGGKADAKFGSAWERLEPVLGVVALFFIIFFAFLMF